MTYINILSGSCCITTQRGIGFVGFHSWNSRNEQRRHREGQIRKVAWLRMLLEDSRTDEVASLRMLVEDSRTDEVAWLRMLVEETKT